MDPTTSPDLNGQSLNEGAFQWVWNHSPARLRDLLVHLVLAAWSQGGTFAIPIAEVAKQARVSLIDAKIRVHNLRNMGCIVGGIDARGTVVGYLIVEGCPARESTPQFTKRYYRKGRIPSALRRAVYERDDYRCIDCGSVDDLSCDHIEPEAYGGPTTLENLATRCRPCNTRKGVRIP
jgi:hypothetical protein